MSRTTVHRTHRRIRPAARVGAVLGALSLVLAACSAGESVDVGGGGAGGDSTGGDAPAGTIVAAIGSEPDQLDPNSTTSYASFQVLENVFDTLVQPDENLEMQPALAESWETSEDQLTWTFHMRDGVTWHDGSEFTADDVVYTYNRIIDEDLSSSWRFSNISEVTAPDADTVVITVSTPSPTCSPTSAASRAWASSSRPTSRRGRSPPTRSAPARSRSRTTRRASPSP